MEADTKSWDNEMLRVTGLLTFSVIDNDYCDKVRLDTNQLRKIIEKVDKENPWFHQWKEQDPAPSICRIGNITTHEPVDSRPQHYMSRSYKVEIRPPSFLEAKKIYAYNRYLVCLARELAKLDVKGIHTVFSTIKIIGGGASYATPTVLRTIKKITGLPVDQ